MPDKMQVPDGWQVVRLGDVAHERNQRANSAPQTEVFSVTKHAGFVRSLEYFDRQVFSRDTSNYKMVRRGDLAYATIHLDEGSLGILRYDDTGIISPMYTVFEANKAWTEPEFLFSLMKLPQMVLLYQRIGEGTVHRRKSISFERLGRLSFAIPPLTEQRRILSVLDAIDDAIERTEAVITATERLRDALLHELLTRGVPGWHTEWKDVPGIGTIPADWEVVRLGEIYEVQLGKMLSPKARQGKNPRPYLTNRNVRWGKFDLSDLPTMDFDRREIEKFQLRPGDLLVCEGGDTGRAAVWLGEIADCYYQKALHRLRPIDENAISEFMLAVLMSYATKGILLEHSERTSISHLTRERLLRMRIPHSSRAEQDEIVAALGCVADSIRWAREEQDRIQTLKSSVAAALLMGRVRVDRLGR